MGVLILVSIVIVIEIVMVHKVREENKELAPL